MPILMITAKNQIEDMEQGFAAGTDDYMERVAKAVLVRVIAYKTYTTLLETKGCYKANSFLT